jgi:hypothetical protein
VTAVDPVTGASVVIESSDGFAALVAMACALAFPLVLIVALIRFRP